jgi:hypothetical protein
MVLCMGKVHGLLANIVKHAILSHMCKDTNCSTPESEAVALGLCRKCYNKEYARRRTLKAQESLMLPVPIKIKASRCKHQDRAHYARGFCRTCYVRERRRAIQQDLWEPQERHQPGVIPKLTPEEIEQLCKAASAPAVLKPMYVKPVVLEPDFGPPEEDME